MTSPIDIFRLDGNGSVVWVHAAPSLELAKARVLKLVGHSAGDYLFFNQVTGEKTVLRLGGPDDVPGADQRPQADGTAVRNEGKLNFPDWQAPLQELLLGSDGEKTHDKIQVVEALVFQRLQELHSGTSGDVERQAIDDALALLRTLKRDKLGFPDW